MMDVADEVNIIVYNTVSIAAFFIKERFDYRKDKIVFVTFSEDTLCFNLFIMQDLFLKYIL